MAQGLASIMSKDKFEGVGEVAHLLLINQICQEKGDYHG
jgi:hypothetical protein